MEANAAAVLDLFETKMQIEVPLFQRQYVWEREKHWEPLWEDISRKFTEYLEGRRDAPLHFLGAMVLDQKQTPTTHVPRRQVIDGQQRLTTLQIFLAALRDFCREQGCDELADECEGFTLNRGMMASPEVDRFKVRPTQADRTQFQDVVASGSRTEVERLHPPVRKKYARKLTPRPRMVEAYLFFHDQLTEFFVGTPEEAPLASEHSLSMRLGECFQALKNALQVVVIDLGATTMRKSSSRRSMRAANRSFRPTSCAISSSSGPLARRNHKRNCTRSTGGPSTMTSGASRSDRAG